MVTQYQAEYLASQGHKVSVLTKRREFKIDSLTKNDVDIYYYDGRRIIRKEVGQKKEFQKKLLELTENADVLMVVCPQSFAYTWVTPVIDKISCRKVLFMHGKGEEKTDLRRLNNLFAFLREFAWTQYWNVFFNINKKHFRKFDAVCHLFESDPSDTYFKKYRIASNYIIPNCCENEMFEDATNLEPQTIREKYQINKPFFVLVANYHPRKNQKEAISAYYQSEIKNCSLVFIGSKRNDYAIELENLNERMAIQYPDKEKVKILYNIPRDETRNFIKACYANLLVSKHEQFPISIVEGMAAGKAFICSNVGMVSMLPGGNIYHNENELQYWFKFYEQHPEYVEQMGKIARNYAEQNMKIDMQCAKLEAVLKGR